MLRRLLNSPWLYFSLAGLVLLGGVLYSFRDFRLPPRPSGTVEDLEALRARDDVNVVFVLIDTLRADRLGSYGHGRDTSPVMDWLAERGVRFAHVQAQSSWTKASMASLWTGAYPRRVGISRYPDGLPDGAVLPAEILREAGFVTAGIYRNGWVAPNFGFGQGFDLYHQARIPSATPKKFERHHVSAHALQGSDWDVTESAIEFLRSYGHERFFLYLHYMDVHQYVYEAESGLFGTEMADLYDNAVHWTDRNVSALLATLDERDLLDRTLLVIASDHGEAFYEHGIEGHARNLYREVTETPLILSLPFRLEPGVVVEAPVQNVDVWPTVLDLLGLPPLPNADGRSLVPLIRAAAGQTSGPEVEALASRPAFSELDRSWGLPQIQSRPTVAIVSGSYRMIEHLNDPEKVELYDRGEDAREQRNVAGKRPEVVDALRQEVRAFQEQPVAWESKHVELDEMRIHQLRALGYAISPGEQEDEDGSLREGAPAGG